jgi:predicted GH43/DUF377 family glycosyl hydrolase
MLPYVRQRGKPGPEVLFTGEGCPTEAGLHGTGNTFAPKVLIEGDLWRMWYGAQGADGHDRIHYAESADGAHWTRHGVVLEHHESNLINDPWVMRHGDGYRMYYTVAEEWIVDTIHLAESADGITWERRGEVFGPDPRGDFDALLVGRPCVMHDGQMFHMWYDGRSDFPPALSQDGRWPTAWPSRRHVGHAVSSDGVSWTRTGRVLRDEAGSVHVSQAAPDRWVMLIETRQGTEFTLSHDGESWGRRRLLLPLSGGPWDRWGHITPFLHYGADGGPAAVYAGLARRSSWTEQAMGRFALDAAAVEALTGGSGDA